MKTMILGLVLSLIGVISAQLDKRESFFIPENTKVFRCLLVFSGVVIMFVALLILIDAE